MSWLVFADIQAALGSDRWLNGKKSRKGKLGDWMATTRIVSKEKRYKGQIHTRQCTTEGFANIVHCDERLRSLAPVSRIFCNSPCSEFG
jgi:hypothetical protein